MRKLGTFFSIIAVAALVWLGRSFFSSDSLHPAVLLLILGLIIVALLFRKGSKNPHREVGLPPSQRKKAREHKSWISRIDQD